MQSNANGGEDEAGIMIAATSIQRLHVEQTRFLKFVFWEQSLCQFHFSFGVSLPLAALSILVAPSLT